MIPVIATVCASGMLQKKLEAIAAAGFAAVEIFGLFGSGVPHGAFATDDIAGTVKRLVANGVAMLPIPENYYDDIEARADLAEEQVAAMKMLNILCDRDEHGAFRQADTQTLDGRLFFEMVHRDGYGAVNAGVRLTAQARLARPITMLAFGRA